MAAAAVDVAAVKLRVGSEVRVTVDHIIEDALVVSLRFEEKLFSGVLMDVSRRVYSGLPKCIEVHLSPGLTMCF